MHISEFNFHLPPELIAQNPVPGRDSSRMLVVDRQQKQFYDRQFSNFPSLLRAGDCLVLNDTRVFPARLKGRRAGFSAQVEIFLIRRLKDDQWEALVKPGRALKPGAKAVFGENQLEAEILSSSPNGRRVVSFTSHTGEPVDDLIDRLGVTPLPPYIKRDNPDSLRLDEETYQTIFARNRGAIAAPTAGLHFTDKVVKEIRELGVEIVTITHHVGYGTFQPVRVENIEEHHVELEHFIIESETANTINRCRRDGGRIIAVGTTTTRALESAVNESKEIIAAANSTELYIYPGYQFRAIDALLTNFHLPQSSLLILITAFGGYQLVMDAYRHAVDEKYRFYSYGDCMFLY